VEHQRGIPRQVIRAAVILALIAAISGCGSPAWTPPAPPSEAAARSYLQRLVAAVATRDPAAICALGTPTCAKTLDLSDPALLPTGHPRVVATRTIEPSRRPDGIWDVGGRVLALCGLDGRQQPYSSELLVFASGTSLVSTNPVFWQGTTVPIAETADGPASSSSCP
jgi:hypothetical protein